MVGGGLEDGVEVDCRHAEVLEVLELLSDALESPPVEVPHGDAALRRALVVDGLVPVHEPVPRPLAWPVERLGALLPVRAARKAVREDLVDHRVAVPAGLLRARDVDGDLERGRVSVREGALSRGPARLGAVAPDRAVLGLDVEAVPDDAGLSRPIVCREAQAVPLEGAVHLDELLAVGVRPDAQRAEDDVVPPHVYGQRNGAAQLDGTERTSVLRLGCDVTCLQAYLSLRLLYRMISGWRSW